MFGPDDERACASCTSIADGVNGPHEHLEHHDVAFAAVSRAPLAKLEEYRARMGWTFRWVSSHGSDFNFDFGVSGTAERPNREYNLAPVTGEQTGEWPGMSAFALARRRRPPRLQRPLARHRRAVGRVPVARPRAEGAPGRDLLAPPPLRVREVTA